MRHLRQSGSGRRCRCGKVKYWSHRSAMRALGALAANSRRKTVPFRAYHCPLCDQWHLSSQPKR